jgi:hypothetical protein
MSIRIIERFEQALGPSLSGAWQFQRQERLRSGTHESNREQAILQRLMAPATGSSCIGPPPAIPKRLTRFGNPS